MSAQCRSCDFGDTPLLSGACGGGASAFMLALQALLQARCDVSDACGRVGRDSAQLPTGRAFDFIVVGSGPAGSTAAARLSESGATVLLLEAGPEDPTISHVPAFAVTPIRTHLDWNLTTAVQQNACLSQGGVCRWPRGRMLGGTSSMNGMMYTRGHALLYDAWAAAGIPGWSYNEVLPYFIKSERNLNLDEVDPGYHGSSGPMAVQFFPHAPPMTEAIIQAGEAMGYRRGDLNGFNMTGINRAQMMVLDGLRDEPSRCFLRSAGRAPGSGLRVVINAHVTKVLIDPATRTAYGVQFVDSAGQLKEARALREVILSAGAIGSPHLLLLSGVGPKEHLRQFGVPVVLDLPGVGRNLHNQVSVAVPFLTDEPFTRCLSNKSVQDFLRYRNGTLASTGLTQVTGFFLSKYASNGVPDIQVFFDGYNCRCSKTGADGECEAGDSGKCGPRVVRARPTNLFPRSRGHVRLTSADPLQPPELQPNYLREKRDMDVMIDGIRLVQRMAKTPPLKKLGFRLDSKPSKGCEKVPFDSDEYWRCVVRTATGPEHHQAGTCKMGPPHDPMAVVDERLRVRGIRALRVADASVFPVVPNSNPTAAIVMTGEKLADMVLQDTVAHTAHTGGLTSRSGVVPTRTHHGFAVRSPALYQFHAFYG
ncbi:glucose dehydrogenase [FAD, quinone]-like [Schistocerca americana]|uniref:glucose dehydrogenase [FAD, quinone]-like n=1 Tax=Schistocerca americana TaxID=7009 RepID=UPI001F4F250F|nr:glucose dehydrogenase [FAD, quinone]-like [Schistocerca americana]